MGELKDKLSACLTRGKLNRSQREAFESMWDQIHRTKLTFKQKAWVESVYHGQRLDEGVRHDRAPKTMVSRSDVSDTMKFRSLAAFRKQFPQVKKGTPQYDKVKTFFESGGEVLEIRPKKG